MDKLVTLIKNATGFFAIGAVDISVVESVEKKFGFLLADEYKAYVQSFGAATFNGHELTGICNSNRLNVIAATERAREFYPQFPKNVYVVEEMQFDHILIIQDSSGAVFSYGPSDKAMFVAKALREYLFPNDISEEDCEQ